MSQGRDSVSDHPWLTALMTGRWPQRHRTPGEVGPGERRNDRDGSGQNGAAQRPTIHPATAPNITPVMRIGA